MSTSRRQFLAGLAAAAAACQHPAALQSIPDAVIDPAGPIRLGWRWVPGVRMTFRTLIHRDVGPVTWTRAEDWQYTARTLDSSGIAALDGRLVGFGASVSADGHALEEDKLDHARDAARRATPDSVSVSIRLSGPIVSCSARGFGLSLPHRMLAIHFPAEPLRVGDAWDEDGLARAFAPILPLDVDVATLTSARLSGVEPSGDAWRATIDHHARLGIGEVGPGVTVEGTTTWDTGLGAIRSRKLHARWDPDATTRGAPAGGLRVEMTRLGGV